MTLFSAAWNGGRLSAALRFASCWTLVVFWALFASPTWATERVYLGHHPAGALAGSADPRTAEVLTTLRQHAASRGTARVIVGVRVPFAPEGHLDVASVAQQRSEIATAHEVVLNTVPSLRQKPDHLKRFQTIPFMAMEVTPAELEELAKLPEVTSIEEDRLALPNLAESVPLIGGTTAWANGYTGNGWTVAILDTGVDKTHPFLSGKVVSEACYSSNNAGQGASTICPGGATTSTAVGSAMPYGGTCPAGECDHGTHVAGIAAGNGTSLPGIGYAGVAKAASVIAIQVFSRFTASACGGKLPCAMSYTSDQILGLQRVYALRGTYNIAAVNMSLGGGSYSSPGSCDAANLSQKAAIDTLHAANIATVISSGNEATTTSLSSPGCISSAISVGATWDSGSVDSVASYSNSAWFLSLLAPGSVITSSTPSNTYGSWQGTSMAAPHVTGAWALLKQKAPTATVHEVLAALSSTGMPVLDGRNGITKPRISLPAALDALVTGVNYTLSVTKAGAGTGSVTSSPAGIDCGATCSASFASGALVTLNAAGTGSGYFTGWSGACSGAGSCTVTMNAAQSVTASFAVGTVITPISQANLSGATGTVQYFSVAVPSGTRNLVIQTSGGTGDVDMYLRATSVPTTSVYDCAPLIDGNNETCAFATPLATTYHIMLVAYAAYSGVSLTVNYTTAPPMNTGVLNFTNSAMTVMKNAGNAVVTVARTGGSDGAASVLFSTSSGTALAGVDYSTSVGNLTWATADTGNRTISVPIINNSVHSATPKRFMISLTSATGSVLGSSFSVTVDIQDTGNLSMPWLNLLLLED